MDSLLAFTLIFIVYAIGDAVATKTKGVISMMLFAFVFYLIGFWTFLPATALEDSGFTAVSNALLTEDMPWLEARFYQAPLLRL